MEKMIKVETKNSDGILISKEVPENLLSMYLNMGWKRVIKPISKPIELK